MAQTYFDGSAASKPAALQLEAIQKKYPLHRSGALLEVGFRITNPGPGHALDVSVSLGDTDLDHRGQSQHLVGQLSSGNAVDVTFDARVVQPLPTTLCEVESRWRNADGSASQVSDVFELPPQRADIDWDQWATEDVYSLEPVENPEDLIGRDHLLRQLQRTVTLRSIGSTFISGQRRVGKTSLVKTLITDLLRREPGIHSVFVEAGGFLGAGRNLDDRGTRGRTLPAGKADNVRIGGADSPGLRRNSLAVEPLSRRRTGTRPNSQVFCSS